MLLTPKTELRNIPKITPKYVKLLEKLELKTVEDLLFYFPFRYDDFSQTVLISEEYLNQTVTVQGTIIKSKLTRIFRRHMSIVEIIIQNKPASTRGDESTRGGNNTPLKAVWFNQPYIYENLKEGTEVRLSGKIIFNKKYLSMSNPAWERSARETTNTGAIIPVYSETRGLTSKWIRWQIKPLLESAKLLEDPIPYETRKKLNLYDLYTALTQIHFPDSDEKLLRAQKRFAFQEMFLVQLKTLQVRSALSCEKAVPLKFEEKLIQAFVKELPFRLTNAQRKASFEILKDLEKTKPMNRLLNGDVGSGKTIVAAISALQVLHNKFQVVLMAPTEVLARQHFLSLCDIFKNYDFNIALLTNSYQEIKNSKLKISNLKSNPNDQIIKLKSKTANRKNLLAKIKSGEINLVIGTHALIQKSVIFHNLALIIIDEQHRFGVAQRAYLQQNILTNTDYTRTNTDSTLTVADNTQSIENEKNNLLYEDLTYKIRKAIFNVKKELGLTHKENIYQKALEEEFKSLGLKFEKEKSLNIKYKEKKIGTYRPDFIIEKKIILELKALPSIGKSEKQQLWHYLKNSNYKLALLVNFGKDDIHIQRFIYTKNSELKKEISPTSALSPHTSASSPCSVSISPHVPHFLTMTATPIPRTLALSVFGNLDLSILDEMPKNRKTIITKIITPAERNNIYKFIQAEINKGQQCFVILPLVEESKVLTEVKAATQEHKRLSEKIFTNLSIGLLHGKLKSQEKEKVMLEFKEKKIDILVATAVVEVGIDIPNATAMIIEDADRFGLSQLHQFRGRVGRNSLQSYCFLFSTSNTQNSKARLKAMEENADGFKIAEKDLELRGPGQFLGTIQSGLPDIAMENLTNVRLIKVSQEEAKNILREDPTLKNYPALTKALTKFNEKIHLE